MIEAVLEGFVLGVSAAAPIGPINVEIIRRGLRLGPSPAFFLGCGAVTADCVYFGAAIAATSAASAFFNSAWGVPAAFAVGGAMLAWLGTMAIRSRAAVDQGGELRSARSAPFGSWAVGLAMTLANPLTIAFWLSVAATIAARGATGGPAALRILGVGAGALGWVGFLVALLALARRRVTPGFLQAVNLMSGASLLGFGIRFWILAALSL